MSELGLATWQELGGKTLEEQRILEFLTRAGDAAKEARRCERRLQEAWAECQRITAQIDSIPGGSGDVHKDTAWAAYAELKTELEGAYIRAKRLELRAETLLQRLTKTEYRAVLSLRYMQSLRWPMVQEGMAALGFYYEERNIYNIHDNAVRQAASLWGEDDMTT